MSRSTDHTVVIIMDLQAKHRSFPYADQFGDVTLWGTGDSLRRHRQYRYYSGTSASRALELAAYDCAARCIDFLALEVTPTA